MKIDLHCHSKYSHDNYFEPEDLIKQAIKMNLDGVCFTEHHSFMASDPVKKILIPDRFHVFRGVEISTDKGHLLAYGLKDDSWNLWSRNNFLDAFAVVERIHSLGGICVPAHPFRGWDSFGENVLKLNGFDAIETHNGLNSDDDNERALQAARTRKLPSTGGSDCHNREQVGRAFTLFKNPVHTMEDLVEGIRNGECEGCTI